MGINYYPGYFLNKGTEDHRAFSFEGVKRNLETLGQCPVMRTISEDQNEIMINKLGCIPTFSLDGSTVSCIY